MNNESKALELCKELARISGAKNIELTLQIGTELRRQHAEIERLRAQLAQRVPEVGVPLNVLEDASAALGNFCADLGWGDSDMQAMDNLDAFIARHKAMTCITTGALLYTTPQQASKPMTRKQINEASADAQADFFNNKHPTYEVAFVRAVERHHKIGEKQ